MHSRYHPLRTVRGVSLTEGPPGQCRTPLGQTTPLCRDSTGRRPPGQRPPGQQTPSHWTETPPMDRIHLDRDPSPGCDHPPGQMTPPLDRQIHLDRDPSLGSELPPWTETPPHCGRRQTPVKTLPWFEKAVINGL